MFGMYFCLHKQENVHVNFGTTPHKSIVPTVCLTLAVRYAEYTKEARILEDHRVEGGASA